MSFVNAAYRALFARPRFKRLNSALFRLSLHGLGVMNFWNDRTSGEHHFISNELPRLVRRPAPVFFDVGANVGAFSLLLLQRFPAATIHAFEPHPRTYARLAGSAAGTARLQCHNCAVGDRSGSVTLYDRADSDGSSHASLYQDVIVELHKQQVSSIEVPMLTLDQLCSRESVEFIDFLKIDTEGHELAVLKGASELLRAQRIGCVQFEFNEMNIASRVFLRDFRAVLRGYSLFRLLPTGLLELGDSPLETELFAYQNVVAIRNT